MDKFVLDKMPRGITHLSTEFIEREMKELRLSPPFAIDVERQEDGNLITSVYFQDPKDGRNRIILQTDGFEVGYGGEGPCGLLKLLTKTGMIMTNENDDPRRIRVETGIPISKLSTHPHQPWAGYRWYSKTQPWVFPADKEGTR
jgi:hypothetical protein